MDSLPACVVPNVHGADRLFIRSWGTLHPGLLLSLDRRCARDSLVLTSSHPGLVALASGLGFELHVFRWTDAYVCSGMISTRWAEPNDLKAVHDFFVAWHRDEPSPVEKWAIAQEDRPIMGIIAQAASTPTVGFLSSLIVDPTKRRRGVGYSLLAYAVNEHVRALGCAALIHRSSNLPSRRLSDRLGLHAMPFVALESPDIARLAEGNSP